MSANGDCGVGVCGCDGVLYVACGEHGNSGSHVNLNECKSSAPSTAMVIFSFFGRPCPLHVMLSLICGITRPGT